MVLKTDVDRAEGEELIRNLEYFRAALGVLASLDYSDKLQDKIRVYAFRSELAYRRLSDSTDTAGFYVNTPEGGVAVIHAGRSENEFQLSGRQILLHEYAHHLLHHYSSFNYPTWYDEGFADYVSTMEFDGGKTVVGKPLLNRFFALRQNQNEWLPIGELVNHRTGYLKNRRSSSKSFSDRSFQYSQGWLLTHFVHNSADFAPRLPAYLTRLSQSRDSTEQVFQTSFGVSYEEMGQAVRKYWKGQKLPYQVYDLSETLKGISIVYELLEHSSDELIESEASVRAQMPFDLDSAYAVFSSAQKLRPVAMRELRVEAALQAEAWDRAERAIAELEQQEPTNAWLPIFAVRRFLGKNYEENHQSWNLSREEHQHLKANCETALERNPSSVWARLLDARSDIAAEAPDEHTLERLLEVRELAPDLTQPKYDLVYVLAKLGRVDEALNTVNSLLRWSAHGASPSLRRLKEQLLLMKNSQ
ncbi:MAG: hypothetical protein AAFQ82_07525 [Myxococcota bacterium]